MQIQGLSYLVVYYSAEAPCIDGKGVGSRSSSRTEVRKERMLQVVPNTKEDRRMSAKGNLGVLDHAHALKARSRRA